MADGEPTNFPVDAATWELDAIFEGGAASESFRDHLEEVRERIAAARDALEEAAPLADVDPSDGDLLEQWSRRLADIETLRAERREADSYARTVASAHADDPEATRLPSLTSDLRTRWEGLERRIVERFRDVCDDVFEELADRCEPEIPRTTLEEYRDRARRAMSAREEELAVELGRDGLHAWGHHYHLVSGRLTVDYEPPDSDEDERKALSVGRAKSLLSSPDRSVRKRAAEALEASWSGRSAEFASILTHVLGSRLTLADRRGVDLLVEPLENNRIERETLDAMWEGVRALQPALREYLKAKGEHLSDGRVEWFDLNAPVGGSSETDLGWREAQEFVVDAVEDFSAAMADFYRTAFRRRWVEGEDRDGKAQGAFCVPFPASETVRVFTTFGGTLTDAMTLAHELGHAYHFDRLTEEPPGAQRVPMTLAETASTLSERAVESTAISESDGEALFHLLDGRLQRATTFLLGIPARYQLEHRMLEARDEGPLAAEELAEMTETAFREQFGDSVASVERSHWASKLHYYLTREPFYNFPYTFGYLFSRAVHRYVTPGGPELQGDLESLLRDTGRMRAEPLADKYLDADLSDPDFWRSAGASVEEDVERFRELANESA